MFLIVAIIALVNAFAHNTGFVLEYRYTLRGAPLNIFDGLLAFGVIVSLFSNRHSESYSRAPIHAAIWWILAAFAIALVGGLLAAAGNAANTREISASVRDFLSLPICVYLGYCALRNPKADRRFLYVSVLAGIVVSVMILLFFSAALEQRAGTNSIDINTVRAVAYVSNYAGLACAVLLFTVVCGIRIMPTPLALILAGFCLIGQFATLSRSDWLATTAGIAAIYTLLPRGGRGAKILAGLFIAVVMFFSLWGGLYFASRVSGRDFYDKMVQRVLTMLPGDHGDVAAKAWATRLPGAIVELQMWLRSPIYGHGFGIQDALAREGAETSFRHNTWTSTLAETGLLGFTAMCLVVGTSMVVGRRLVRARLDAGSVLIGALGVITAYHFIVLGLTTMSFNKMRWAIPLATTCGVVLRARAMQLATAQAYAGYLEPGDDGMQPMLADDGDGVLRPSGPSQPFGGEYASPEGYGDGKHATAWPS